MVLLVLLGSVYLDLLDLTESRDQWASSVSQVSHVPTVLSRTEVSKEKQT